MYRTITIAALLVSGCASKPTASDVCQRLVAAGVAQNCKQAVPAVISARAETKFEFDLPSVPGKTGQVLTFKSAEDYAATAKAFEGAAFLAGSHRYGSEKALVFVQLNDKAPLDVGNKAKTIVGEL